MEIQAKPPYNRAYFALAIIVLAILIFSLRNEPDLTYDSLDYLDASESMVTYFEGENGDGFAYTLRPPLYPFFLSFFSNKISAAWWLNVVCFLSSLWIIVLITEHLKWQPVWIYACVFLTAISLPWLQNHFFVWTEPLFCAILFLLFHFLLKKKSITIIIVTCLILFSIRKAGLFIIILTCFYYLLNKQWRNFLLLAIVSAVFVVGWEVLVSSFADRSPFISNFEYLINLDRFAFIEVVTTWVLPGKIPLAIRVGIISFALILIAITSKEYFRHFLKEEHNKLFVIYLVGYCLFFVVVVGSTGYHETERYLSVIVPLFIMIVVSFTSQMHEASMRAKKVFYFLFLFWSLYPLARTINYFITQ